jgi:ankyrin repeat protein
MNLQFIEYDTDKKIIRIKINLSLVAKSQLENFLSDIKISYEENPLTHIYTFKDYTMEDFLQKTQGYFLTKGGVNQEDWQEFTRKTTAKVQILQGIPQAVLNSVILENLGIQGQAAMARILPKEAQPNYLKLLKLYFPEHYQKMLKDRERENLIFNAERKPGDTAQLPPIDYKLIYKQAHMESYEDNHINSGLYGKKFRENMLTQFKEGNLEKIKEIQLFATQDAWSQDGSYNRLTVFGNILRNVGDSRGRDVLAWAHKNNQQEVLDYIYAQAMRIETGLNLVKWALRCHQKLEVVKGIRIDNSKEVTESLMRAAAECGHVDMVRSTLDSLLPVDFKKNITKILNQAIKYSHLNVIQYLCEEKKIKLDDYLLDRANRFEIMFSRKYLSTRVIRDYIYQWMNDNMVDATGYLKSMLVYHGPSIWHLDKADKLEYCEYYKSTIDYSVSQGIDLNAVTIERPQTLLGHVVHFNNVNLVQYACAIYKNKNDSVAFSLAVREALEQSYNHETLVYLLRLSTELLIELNQVTLANPNKTILQQILTTNYIQVVHTLNEKYAGQQLMLDKIIEAVLTCGGEDLGKHLLAAKPLDPIILNKALVNVISNDNPPQNSSRIKFLLDNGANPNGHVASGFPCLIAYILSIRGRNVDKEVLSVIDAFISKKSNVNATFVYSLLPTDELQKLIKKNNSGSVYLPAAEIPGFTALHLAVMLNQPEVVKKLLKNGADITIKALNITPLDIAFANKSIDINITCSLLAMQNTTDLILFLKNELLVSVMDINPQEAAEQKRITIQKLRAICDKYKLDSLPIIRQACADLVKHDKIKAEHIWNELLRTYPIKAAQVVSQSAGLEQMNIIDAFSTTFPGRNMLLTLFKTENASLKVQLLTHPYYSFIELNKEENSLLPAVTDSIRSGVNEWVKAIIDKKDDPLYPLAVYVESYAHVSTNPRILFGKQKEPDKKHFLGIFMLIHLLKNNHPALIDSIDKLIVHPCAASYLQRGSFREALEEVKNRVQAISSKTMANKT